MVKESDLNKLVVQKTNEALRNKQTETKPITNQKELNIQPGSPVASSQTANLIQPEPSIQTVETIQLDPIKNTKNPILSFLMTAFAIFAFTILVGYFFLFGKKKAKSDEAPTPTTPKDPTTEAKDSSDQTPPTSTS